MVEKSGLHTSKKWGLIRPTDTLAMSVNDWLTAQPKMNTPICGMEHVQGQSDCSHAEGVGKQPRES